jgi:hypothetical protein
VQRLAPCGQACIRNNLRARGVRRSQQRFVWRRRCFVRVGRPQDHQARRKLCQRLQTRRRRARYTSHSPGAPSGGICFKARDRKTSTQQHVCKLWAAVPYGWRQNDSCAPRGPPGVLGKTDDSQRLRLCVAATVDHLGRGMARQRT